jgi:hypothetical protein
MRRCVVALLLACLAAPATAVAANPIQRENARPGTPGWEIPAGAGNVIAGYASQTSVAAGQRFGLHVSAPVGDSYRVLVYRLGFYQGIGGRLLFCLPGCASSRPAVQQPGITPPNPRSGLYVAPWSVTDVGTIPKDAVSGYYEAKLEVVGGPDTGQVGMVPLIVRASHSDAAVLIQVPVNTWQAYNDWGGKSLYGSGSTHATEDSFDRPYHLDNLQQHLQLELPWVRFLERSGVDMDYQTDVDTDGDPGSLLQHRLVFAIGHDEYWTQAMRDGFDRARGLGTNLAFASNTDLWRMRWAAGSNRRVIVEWRSPYADPIHNWRYDTGFFRDFGEPECQLMAVEYQEYAQRRPNLPPTPYTVVGSAQDPWLGAAGLKHGDVIPGVMGYEWDSLVPGCFRGQVVRLMHAEYPGADGIPRSADMVRATARSGAQVWALGTQELGWALDGSSGETPNPQVQAFVKAALADLERPASPARLSVKGKDGKLVVRAVLGSYDPRILRVSVRPVRGGGGCTDALNRPCLLPPPRHASPYDVVAIDRWGRSQPLLVTLRRRPVG